MAFIRIFLIFCVVFSFFLLTAEQEFDLNGNSPRQGLRSNFLHQENYPDNRTEWQGVGPWGGDVTSVAISPDDTSIMYAAMGKPYKSSNSGESWEIWESLAQYSTAILTITAGPDGLIYAGANYEDGLFRSDDHGETWSPVNNFPITYRDIRVITLDPLDPDIVYVGVSGNSAATDWQQIAKSSNGGSNWSILNTDALGITHGIKDIAIDPANTQNIVVCSEGGISGGDAAFSYDGGTSWQNISAGLPTSYPFNDVAIAGTDVFLGGGQLFGSQHVGIYRSQLGEFNWVEISQNFPLPVVNKIIVSPDNDQLIYAATEGDGVYRSVDGGDNWEYSTDGADNFSVLDIIFNPANSLELYIGCKSMAVFKSIDTGTTWESSSNGMATLWINDIAVNPSNPDQILVAFEAENSGGCYISNDGGSSWEVVEDLPPTRYSAVTFDMMGNAYACSQGPTTVASEGVYISFDGGSSWLNTGPDLGPYFETELWDIVASPTTPGLLFIAGNHFGVAGFAATVYRTYDLGSSAWEEVYVGPENDEIHSIALAANSNEQILYAGYTNYNQAGAFIRSMDQGDSWEYINTGVPANCCQSYAVAVHPEDPYVVYAGVGFYSAGFHLLKTENGGDNWTSIYSTSFNPTCLAIDPVNPNRIFAGVYTDGVLISEDDGSSWENISDGLASGAQVSCFSNIIIDENEISFYAGSYNNSAFQTTIPLTDTEDEIIPAKNVLLSNHPNPFNPATTITYNLKAKDVKGSKLNIYNITGQLVKSFDCHPEFIEGSDNQNTYSVTWNGTDETGKPVPSGLYLYQLKTGKTAVSRKMLLLK